MSSTPPDIFLSYNREDQATARRFAEAFERAGYSVWWDVTLRSGEDYDKVTEKALEAAKAVVVLWSKKSVESSWVRAEATQADRNKTLVPVTIEPCKRPIMFELKQTADLSHWKGDANDKVWLALLSDVQRLVQKERSGGNDQPIAATPRRKPAMKFMLAAELLLIAAVAAFALWHYVGGSSQPESKTSAVSTTAPANAATGVSLAVLPFVNLSSEAEQEYFSDGLSEEILNQLAQNKELRVTARTSSFAFKGKNEDLRVIGEKLGVGNILEGSVRKNGKQLRITAQLINTTDGTHRWSKTYERELTDVFAIQDEIAMAVAEALSITLDVGAMSRANGGTNNVEAYDKYLRGRVYTRLHGTGQDWVEAARYYREAATLDPDFVRAWADLHGELEAWSIYVQPRTAEARQEMDTVYKRLTERAPTSIYTAMIKASRLVGERHWAEAEAAITTAKAAGGNFRQGTGSADTVLLLNTGRIQAAIPNVEARVHGDPLALASSYAWQIMLFLANREAEGEAEYQRGKTLAGDQQNANLVDLLRAMTRKDAKPADITARLMPVAQSTGIKWLRSMIDNLNSPPAALALLHQTYDDPANQTATAMTYISMIADYFGDKDLALAALRRKYVDLGGTNIGMMWGPNRTNMRSDPRFKTIVRDLGLVDYWRQSGSWGDFCKPVGSDDFECH